MLHPNIQRAVDVLREEVTDGHRFIARGTDDLIVAAAEELSQLKARVAELEPQLKAVTQELGVMSLAYEMSESIRKGLVTAQRVEGGS